MLANEDRFEARAGNRAFGGQMEALGKYGSRNDAFAVAIFLNRKFFFQPTEPEPPPAVYGLASQSGEFMTGIVLRNRHPVGVAVPSRRNDAPLARRNLR